jgi:hypothetical protein
VFYVAETTTEVNLLKGSQGLGLSVAGGVDSGEQWPGLIRIKRLFLHQPAWQSGQLIQGDILLAANGVPLIGLTNYVSKAFFLFYCMLHCISNTTCLFLLVTIFTILHNYN